MWSSIFCFFFPPFFFVFVFYLFIRLFVFVFCFLILIYIRYFLQVFDKNSYAYNESFMLHFHGELDLATLQKALDMVAERQPTIRSQFFMSSETGHPYKQFSSSFTCTIASHTSPNLETCAMNLLADQTFIPFNLETDPLLRVLLVQGALFF
jgi:hypothetical protein